jgi:hypothetical protein
MQTFAQAAKWAGKNNTVRSYNIEDLKPIQAALALTDNAFVAKYHPFDSPILAKLPHVFEGFKQIWDLEQTPRLIEIASILTSTKFRTKIQKPKELEPLVDFCLVPLAAREYYFKHVYGANTPIDILSLADAGLQTMFNHQTFKHWLINTIDKNNKTVLDPGFAIRSRYVQNQIATGFSLNRAPIRRNTFKFYWPTVESKYKAITMAARQYVTASATLRHKQKYMALVIHAMFPHRYLYRACTPTIVGYFNEEHMQSTRKHMRVLESLGFSYSIATTAGVYLVRNVRFKHPPDELSNLEEKSMGAFRIPKPYKYYKRF